MTDQARRREVEAVFDEALEVSSAEREAWLARRCRGDARLLAEARALLAAHDRAAGILEAPVIQTPAPEPEPALRERRIGPYRLLRELGRGGMGVVYLAERDDGQFRRRVAVKLLRGSPDAEELHRRFLAERQILASLEHPSIAQLLDGGITDGQLPYLVMEYVDGLPVTAYCDRHRLGVEARLRLFQDVCAVVHYAHQNLVIHRDIKPGNILVTKTGQVKLLDFGIAKLLNPGLSALAMPVTRTEYRVMTPEYASPEQVRGETLTTASDIYALGVVLYELLAGHPPYRLTRRSPKEVAELVCERDPERPSVRCRRGETVVDGDGGERAVTPELIADLRETTPDRLARTLRGDLDAIVLMALRKEPGRRYGSADLLSADVERHLEGLPVLAHRESRWYRALKLVRRRRTEAVAAFAVLVALIAGAGVAAWQARVATVERYRAEAALVDAERALRSSEQVTTYLSDLLASADPVETPGGGTTVRDLLRRGGDRIERLEGQPLVQAQLLEVIGIAQKGLGDYAGARELLERALAIRRAEQGGEHPAVARTLYELSDVLRRQGRYALADARSREALAIQRASLGPDHPATAVTLARLAGLAVYFGRLEDAERLSAEALDIRVRAHGPDDPQVASSLLLHGSVQRRRGRHAESRQSLERALEIRQRVLGPDAFEVAETMARLADLHIEVYGELTAGENLKRRALEIYERNLGPDHPQVAVARNELGSVLVRKGDFETALQHAERAYQIEYAAYGPEHPRTAGATSVLAVRRFAAGDMDGGIQGQREAVESFRRIFGDEHQAVTGANRELVRMLMERGDLEEAESLARENLAIRMRDPRGETQLVALARYALASVLVRRGADAEAERLLIDALATYQRETSPDHLDYRMILADLIALYERSGRPELAEPYRSLRPDA